MRGSVMLGGLVAALLAGSGCEGRPQVTTTLVNRRALSGSGPARVVWAVEVRRAPASRLAGWARRTIRLDRPDTIPAIRVLFPPAVVGDSLVVGFTALSGYVASGFTYDVNRRTMSRSALPDWYSEVSDFSTPAFSPDGPYFAYVGVTPRGEVEAIVRSWPSGVVQVRGPRAILNPQQPGGAEWLDSARFVVTYDLGTPPEFVRLAVRGRVGEAMVEVDTIGSSASLAAAPPPALQAPALDTAVERERARARRVEDEALGRREAATAAAARMLGSGDTLVIRAATLIAAVRRTPVRRGAGPREVSALQAQLVRRTAPLRDSLASRPIPFRLAVADSFWLATDSGRTLVGVRQADLPAYYLAPGDRGARRLEGRWSVAEVLDEVDWYLVPTDGPREDIWARADRRIRRLPAAAFSELPPAFADELDRLGCTVPQSDYGDGRPSNVIRGSFGAPAQVDWAVLCSRGGESAILVHWGGPAQCPRELRPARDAHYLQSVGGGRIAFSRAISTVDAYHDHGDLDDTSAVERPHYVKLEHEAIDDAFQGKASGIWFCRAGTWVLYPGAD